MALQGAGCASKDLASGSFHINLEEIGSQTRALEDKVQPFAANIDRLFAVFPFGEMTLEAAHRAAIWIEQEGNDAGSAAERQILSLDIGAGVEIEVPFQQFEISRDRLEGQHLAGRARKFGKNRAIWPQFAPMSQMTWPRLIRFARKENPNTSNPKA